MRAQVCREVLAMSGVSASSGASSSAVGGSFTAEYLIDKWAATEIDAYVVGEICLNLVKDGVELPSIVSLSKIGAEGRCPGNARRDLGRLLDESKNKLPEPYPVQCYCKSVNKHGIKSLVQAPISFFPPHATFAALHAHYPEEFALRVSGESPTAITDFWEAMHPLDPRVRHHPIRAKPRYRQRTIPLKFWSDKTPYGKGAKRSLNVANVSSMLGSGESLDRLFLLWAVPQGINNTTGPDSTLTMRPLYKAFIWSMLALLCNRWPYTDWSNNRWNPTRYKWHKIPAEHAGK